MTTIASKEDTLSLSGRSGGFSPGPASSGPPPAFVNTAWLGRSEPTADVLSVMLPLGHEGEVSISNGPWKPSGPQS